MRPVGQDYLAQDEQVVLVVDGDGLVGGVGRDQPDALAAVQPLDHHRGPFFRPDDEDRDVPVCEWLVWVHDDEVAVVDAVPVMQCPLTSKATTCSPRWHCAGVPMYPRAFITRTPAGLPAAPPGHPSPVTGAPSRCLAPLPACLPASMSATQPDR